MPLAERYAFPIDARIGTSIPRTNDFKELFYVRWGSIWFNVFWGPDLNIKVVLNVYRSCAVCERFIVDTNSYDVQWDRHKRVTRDLYIHPSPAKLGHVTRVASPMPDDCIVDIRAGRDTNPVMIDNCLIPGHSVTPMPELPR